MKKKGLIILISIIAFIWILFWVQHFFLEEYGCDIEYTCIEGCCGLWGTNNTTSKRVCSFKTFLLNEHVSKKLLWFWINTKKLKEKPEPYDCWYNDWWWTLPNGVKLQIKRGE